MKFIAMMRFEDDAMILINLDQVCSISPHSEGGSLISFDSYENTEHVSIDVEELSDMLVEPKA